MRSWHGVVTKIAKQGKGAVVKNRLGPEELLVPFTVSTLVEVDLDARIYGTDVDDTPGRRATNERRCWSVPK